MSEKGKLKIAAEVARVTEVQEYIDAILEAEDCDIKAQMQLDIAVEELFVNIASYAYPDGPGEAEVTVGLDGDLLSITFVDWGIPFDPVAKKDPDVTLAAEDRSIGGLGIYMVKKSMNSMTYERRDGQNILTITKTIHP